MLRVAAADGEVQRAERKLLEALARKMELPAGELDGLVARALEESAARGAPLPAGPAPRPPGPGAPGPVEPLEPDEILPEAPPAPRPRRHTGGEADAREAPPVARLVRPARAAAGGAPPGPADGPLRLPPNPGPCAVEVRVAGPGAADGVA